MGGTLKLPVDEIVLEPSIDNAGRVFRWNNEIYRGIFADHTAFYRLLLASSLKDELIELGLISTKITEYQMAPFGMILKHRTIPAISYPTEWSSAMLKDAALLTCDIQLRLLQSGYTLKDAHPWNILFDAAKPQFTDVGSITEMSSSSFNVFLRDFRDTFLHPLLLKRGEASSVVHSLMLVYLGFPSLPIYRLLFMLIPVREWVYHYLQQRKIASVRHRSPISAVNLLREQIISIHDNFGKKNSSDYTAGDDLSDDMNTHLRKLGAVEEVLEKFRPKSVLDMCSREGTYSKLAASKGARVIAVDKDDNHINNLYDCAKKENLGILPLAWDICAPTMARGAWETEPWRRIISAPERLKSEMIMLLAVAEVHRLVQKHNKTFHDIAHFLSSFTEKLALVEFAGWEDKHMRNLTGRLQPEYNLDNFIEALAQHFSEAGIYRQIDDCRWLILCVR
jgi:hypothetical protein